MANKSRKPWKRSRLTTALIHRIRNILNETGYDEELAITPLANVFSVIASKDEKRFNVRLDKETLEITEVDELKYNRRREGVRMVFRHTYGLRK